MRSKLSFRVRAGVLAGALAVAGCERSSPGDGAEGEVPVAQRYGGTAVLAAITDLQGMNPLASNETFTRSVQRYVLFMPLVRYDAQLRPEPWLAERWDTVRVAPDSLELTFHLRRDVKWHDGRPTTAEDVLFTFSRAIDPAVGYPLAADLAYYGRTATVVDPHTIRFRLRPHAEFLDAWAQLAILPRHLLGDVPPEELKTHPFGSKQPVGNGPFRFVRRVPGQEWVFEANPDFPQALGGRPFLDRLVYRVIPEPNTLLTESLTGAVDVYLGVAGEQTPQLQQSPDVQVLSPPSPGWTFIAWNGKLPMFDTPEERRALSMAIDRAGIVNALLPGHAQVGRATVTPVHWSFDSSDTRTLLPYNREVARRLLARAGWLDRDGDGILEDASGRPFRFTLKSVAGNQTRSAVTQVVQAQLRELGVDVRTSMVEGHTLIAQLGGKVNEAGERERDFEAVTMGLTDNFRKDDSKLFHSRFLNGPFAISALSHPRVDALLDTLGLITDREEARPLWQEYQALMAEQAPFTVLYYPNRTTAVRKRLRGVVMDTRGELPSVTRWWIAPAERGAGGGPPR